MFLLDILNDFYRHLNNKSENISSYAIVIDRKGEYLKDILDEKPYNHATSFNYLASLFNIPYVETESVVEAAKNLNNYGYIALQIRKEYCVIYFPESITLEQYDKLYELLIDKDLSYSYEEETEGFLTQEEILEYAKSLIQEKRKL